MTTAPSTAPVKRPDVLVTTPAGQASVPSWVKPFSARAVAGEELRSLRRLPGITVVTAKGPGAVLQKTDFLHSLAAKHAASPDPSMIIFVFPKAARRLEMEDFRGVLRYFDRPTQVEFARGGEHAALELCEAWAKLSGAPPRAADPSRDPLGEVSAILTATKGLRAASGRLSARRVAETFGLSVSELASLLGKNRQTVSKTDDAQALQPGLAPFARVARLLAVLPEDEFRAWLNLPNEQLEERSPLAVIREGGVDQVADLAEDMLSGSLA